MYCFNYPQGNLPEALKLYTAAAEAAQEQREIEHICLYEKGENYICTKNYLIAYV